MGLCVNCFRNMVNSGNRSTYLSRIPVIDNSKMCVIIKGIIYKKRGQLKIQQMAFVLVALVVFFALVFIFYISIRVSNLEEGVVGLKEDETREIVKKIGTSAEFVYSQTDCSGCVDLDKVLILKERNSYKDFWGLDYLQLEVIGEGKECNKFNYPECKTITLVNNTKDFGSVVSSFAPFCYWEAEKGGYKRCVLGRIYASGKGI